MSRTFSHNRRLIPPLIALLLLMLACNLPLRSRAARGPDATITAAILTVQVQLTQTAGALVPTVATTQAPTVQGFTLTPRPSVPTVFVPTSVPPTAVSRCNWAQFMGDVTIPDGTKLSPGQVFTKTWRLKNIGTCTWTTEYALAFENGDPMGAPAAVSIGETVPPGDTIDISLNLTAPASPGKKTGYFKLRNPGNIPFGIGWDAQQTFYVSIEVLGPTPTPTHTATPTKTSGAPAVVYDFTDSVCDAEWRSSAGVLDCPGEDDDDVGFVMPVSSPILEDGEVYIEDGLWTHPQWISNGVISGRYPSFNVIAGDRFHAVIGCLYEGEACSVTFQLNYRADGGALQNLGQWNQTYDGTLQTLNVDLTPLAGKSVEFALAVLAGPDAGQDWAVWLYPRIVR